MTRWRFIVAQLRETALWLDQGGNVLAGWVSFCWSLVTFDVPPQVHSAEETISAHLYRRNRQGTHWGRALMPVVDRVFAIWQRDENGNPVRNHCERAFQREMSRYYLPPEYRQQTDA